MPSNRFPLTLLAETFAVCKLDPDGRAPTGMLDGDGPFACVMRTGDELCVVCTEDDVPATALKVERGFRAFKLEGPVPFTTVGVVSSMTKPLADAGISVFVLSTYDTDYLMVNEANVERASKRLARAGFVVARPEPL
ncbi:MAG: ACT domain-containing protein [Thermoplasmatota archaeon]